jgi:TolB-like protein
MSPARDQEFFCEGMSEEIINALGRVSDLRAASCTSSIRLKGKEADTQSIGQELTVSWLLEGSVRKSGELVRIAVQLVRASDAFSAWSGRFDRHLDNNSAVQDEIAAMIVQTLTRRVAKPSAPLVTSTTANTRTSGLRRVTVRHRVVGCRASRGVRVGRRRQIPETLDERDETHM